MNFGKTQLTQKANFGLFFKPRTQKDKFSCSFDNAEVLFRKSQLDMLLTTDLFDDEKLLEIFETCFVIICEKQSEIETNFYAVKGGKFVKLEENLKNAVLTLNGRVFEGRKMENHFDYIDFLCEKINTPNNLNKSFIAEEIKNFILYYYDKIVLYRAVNKQYGNEIVGQIWNDKNIEISDGVFRYDGEEKAKRDLQHYLKTIDGFKNNSKLYTVVETFFPVVQKEVAE